MNMTLKTGQFHDRKIYLFPACATWIRTEVPQMVTDRMNAATSPVEQLRERMRQWIAGEAMREGRWFHDLAPKENCIWELKTFDLRIFGWMYRPREFIAVRGGYADDYKEPTKMKTYAEERQHVIAVRDALPLDGAKFATGDFDDLV